MQGEPLVVPPRPKTAQGADEEQREGQVTPPPLPYWSRPRTAAGKQSKTLLVRAREAYDGRETPGHLSLSEGQVVELLSACEESSGGESALWRGRALLSGKEVVGLFPASIVSLVQGFEGKPVQMRVTPELQQRQARCSTLFHGLLELVDTELRHVCDLRTVLTVLIEPFEAQFGRTASRQVFSDWVPMLRVHEQLLRTLSNGLPSLALLADAFLCVRCDVRVQLAMRTYPEPSSSSSSPVDEPESRDKSGGFSVEEEAVLRKRLSMLEHVHREHLRHFDRLDSCEIVRFEELLETLKQTLCRAMIEMSDWLKLCIPCIINQGVKYLKKLPWSALGPKPQAWMQMRINSECERLHHLNLAAFLIKPMQRITKYPLLIKQYGDPECLRKLSKIADDVNRQMKLHQDAEQQRKAAVKVPLLRPKEAVKRLGLERQRLHRSGKVSFQTISASNSNQSVLATQHSLACQALLFTNALVLAQPMHTLYGRKYQILKSLSTSQVIRLDCQNGCLAVRSACSLLLITPLEDDAETWEADLRECLKFDKADRERLVLAETQKLKQFAPRPKAEPSGLEAQRKPAVLPQTAA